MDSAEKHPDNILHTIGASGLINRDITPPTPTEEKKEFVWRPPLLKRQNAIIDPLGCRKRKLCCVEDPPKTKFTRKEEFEKKL